MYNEVEAHVLNYRTVIAMVEGRFRGPLAIRMNDDEGIGVVAALGNRQEVDLRHLSHRWDRDRSMETHWFAVSLQGREHYRGWSPATGPVYIGNLDDPGFVHFLRLEANNRGVNMARSWLP